LVWISVWSAIATFFAADEQPRRSIERLMSSRSTVLLMVVSSERETSKSSGPMRTGVPGPPRAMALNRVRLMSTANGSPNS
jgi:hypothetical protein